jgi:vancomycin aglycone glucosyltransferase
MSNASQGCRISERIQGLALASRSRTASRGSAAANGHRAVVIPQKYDQHYWAQRVECLGIGAAHMAGAPTTASLTRALERTLQGQVADRARSIATAVRLDGARVAAERVIAVGNEE